MQHSKKRTSYQLWSVEVEVSWFGDALLLPGQLTIIESTMNSTVYQRVLEEHVEQSKKKIKLKQNWTLQHDNDPKHTRKSTRDWLKKEKWKGQLKAQILIPMRSCGVTWNGRYMQETPQTSHRWEFSIEELGKLSSDPNPNPNPAGELSG